MYHSIYDFKDFYNSAMGGVVKHVLRQKIRNYWHNVKGMRVVGIGYTQPYLDLFEGEADRLICINPAEQGGYPWPANGQNLSVLAEETELPIETNSVDRVLLVHSLEFAEIPKSNLQEIFRILKSNGRLIVLAPNRRGVWARAEWTPFGHGTPYSGDQLKFLLRDTLFVYEQSSAALYMPPFRWNIIRRTFEYFEACLPYIVPAIGGIHIVEASKQVYSGTQIPADSKVIVRARSGAGQNVTAPVTRIMPRR